MVTRAEHFEKLPAIAGTTGQWHDTRSDLVKTIQNLEHADSSLKEIRATVVVNFSVDRAHAGIVIKEHPSVLHMLVQIFEAYDRKLSAYQTAIREIEGERERLQQMWDERPGMVEHRAAESILDALDNLKNLLS